MKFTGKIVLFGLVIFGLLLGMGCKEQEKDHGETGKSSPTNKAESIPAQTNGMSSIQLDTETQRRIGLQVQTLAAAQLQRELKGHGRVMDAVPLATLCAELEAARAAFAATRREYERLKSLNEQDQNASLRALQAAEAIAERDRIQVESTRQRLISGWGGAIAGRDALTTFAQSLTTLESALLRIDLPAGVTLATPPRGARVATIQDENRFVEATFLSLAPSVDPQTQGQGFLFLVQTNALRLVPGTSVTGYLLMADEAQTGVKLPRNAVVRAQGKVWAYFQTDEQHFVRREIVLERPVEDGWFLQRGVSPGDRVVVMGAQQLLSEEFKAQTKMLD